MKVKKQLKIINAKYVEETKSILILGECPEGRLTPQLHRDDIGVSLDSLTEFQKTMVLSQFAEDLKGKTKWIEFEGSVKEEDKGDK